MRDTPREPASGGVGIGQDVCSQADASDRGSPETRSADVFDESRLLAVLDFRLGGYLNGKAGAGLMRVVIFLCIAGWLVAPWRSSDPARERWLPAF